MVSIRVLREFSTTDLTKVLGFLEAARGHGRARLNDHLRADLQHGQRAGFVAAVAHEAAGEVVGYAQASAGNDGFVVDAIVWSAHDDEADEVRVSLLRHVLAEVPDDAPITWWTRDGDTAGTLAPSIGLSPGRALLQMRRPLPMLDRADVSVRPFRVGADELAWLEVNNAAFAWHGEQGGWDLSTLQQREREAWFRPQGFLLHERDGRLAGFCWTKLHAPARADQHLVGEIYVIAVHPDFHGLGLGRALTLAGLANLHEAGATEGMLYVDAANAAAVHLYERLGFEVSHTDQAYVRFPGGSSS